MIILYICPILLYVLGFVLFFRNVSRLTTMEDYFDIANAGIGISYGLYGSATIILIGILQGPYSGFGDFCFRLITSVLISFGINALTLDALFRTKKIFRNGSKHNDGDNEH